MSTDYVPRKDRDFLTYVKNILAYVSPKLEAFLISKDRYLEIETLTADFSAKLDTAENPATRTHAAIAAKNSSRATLADRFRAFVSEYLQNNSAVTDDDRNAMGVPVHKKTRTPAKRPDTIPSLKNLIHRASRVYELFVVDATHEGRAKPPQVHGYEVGYLIGLAGLTVVPEQFTHSIFDTRTPCILHFEPETLGQTLYIAFRWENTIGEKGDWSEVYSFVIG